MSGRSQDAGSLTNHVHAPTSPRLSSCDLYGAGSRLHSLHSSLVDLAARFRNVPHLAASFQRSADHYASLIALDENAWYGSKNGEARFEFEEVDAT
jgi:hypothetical protein